MRILSKKEKENPDVYTTYGELEVGDYFLRGEDVYIITDEKSNSLCYNGELLAYHLEGESLEAFDEETKVKKIQPSLYVKIKE